MIDGREVSTVVYASPLSASTGLTVHRLAARAVIQDWEHGCLSADPVEHVVRLSFISVARSLDTGQNNLNFQTSFSGLTK